VADEQWGQPAREVDFFDVKRDVESLYGVRASQLTFEAQSHSALHPGRSARILLAGQAIGWIGELHPRWVQAQDLSSAPVLFEVTLESLQSVSLPVVGELSRQPVVQRDLAVWVPAGVEVGAMLATIHAAIASDPTLAVVRQVRLFDVWRDPSAQSAQEKSLAFRLWLQDSDVTLDDARVDECIGRIRAALESAHQARPR
jgi:phenylalanyl-tRNA synthetase beta chain